MDDIDLAKKVNYKDFSTAGFLTDSVLYNSTSYIEEKTKEEANKDMDAEEKK